jgi:hypothetical protein
LVNILERLLEPAGGYPASFDKFHNDFFGRPQYLFVNVCHETLPLFKFIFFNKFRLLANSPVGVKAFRGMPGVLILSVIIFLIQSLRLITV